jgi:hypothetical protein
MCPLGSLPQRATYLHIAIDIEKEWLLAKVDQDVVAGLFEAHCRIELPFDVFEGDISKRDP